MYKTLRPFILVIFLMNLFSLQVFAADVTEINQLIENAKAFNSKLVTVKGEAIGEVMQRGEYSWVNINDGTNAIGIWMKSEDAQQITYYGNYKNIGDTIIVTGVFHRACSEHGGEADIHSEALKIEEKGFPVVVKIPAVKVMIAVVLLLVLSGIYIAVYHFKILKNSSV